MATNDWSDWDEYDEPYNGSPTSAYGGSVALDVHEDRYLETIPEVDSTRGSKRSSTYTFASSRLSRAMPQAVQRLSRPHNLDPAWVPSARSSMYEPRDEENRRESYADISPPSTPRKSWGGSFDETPVSPIEPVPPIPQLPSRPPLSEQQTRTQIPRKIPATAMKKEPTKWDKFSGERTNDDSGVSGTVRPGTTPLEEQFELKERTRQILANLRARGQAQQGQISPTTGSPSPSSGMAQRDPWRGQSGRSAIVDPVYDTPSVQKEPLRRANGVVNRKEVEAKQPLTRKEVPAALQSIRSYSSQTDLRPVPLKISKSHTPSPPPSSHGPPRSATFPVHVDHVPVDPGLSPSPPHSADARVLQSPFHSPQPPKLSVEEPLPLSSTRTESPQHETSPQTPRTPSPEPYQAVASIPQTSADPMEPEVSRFSWTTYATSVTDSPSSAAHLMRGDSPPPPVPVLPDIHKQSSPYQKSLDSDPDAARAQGTIIIRKPVPVPSLSIPSPSASRGRKKSGDLSRTKTLPRVPPEVEAADKISGFKARLDALARRKHNLNRIISNLKDDLEKNRVNYDIYKRKDVEAKVEGYEKELQSAMSDEHQIGLLLHRAVKKRDREDGYELPTGLWIRRVTS